MCHFLTCRALYKSGEVAVCIADRAVNACPRVKVRHPGGRETHERMVRKRKSFSTNEMANSSSAQIQGTIQVTNFQQLTLQCTVARMSILNQQTRTQFHFQDGISFDLQHSIKVSTFLFPQC
jgi:hypothetical protein